jgi:YD repeat-containing protein
VLTETKVITGAGTFTTSYGYGALDRVITTTYPTGEVVTQTYNNAGQLENVRSINGAQSYNQWYASNLDYNANGALTRLDLNNGLSTLYTYYPLSFRLKTIQTGIGGAMQNLTYRYDNVGNVLTTLAPHATACGAVQVSPTRRVSARPNIRTSRMMIWIGSPRRS